MQNIVYIIESDDKKNWYVGLTSDIEKRLEEHNKGKSPHTSKFNNWKIKSFFTFTDPIRALEFEKYLKSHSGRAFAKKRL